MPNYMKGKGVAKMKAGIKAPKAKASGFKGKTPAGAKPFASSGPGRGGQTKSASGGGVAGKSTGSKYVPGAPTSGGFKHGPVKPSAVPKGPQVKTMSHQKRGR